MTVEHQPFFPPPEAAAALYNGQVMHARMKPKTHRFTYSVYALSVDIDQLDRAHRLSRFFSVNRFNLLSFHASDHGNGGTTPLGTHVRALLTAAGLDEPPVRILLTCYPRVLGFTFNPIAVYFAYGATGQLVGTVYEVRNTFGEMHTYVAPVQDGELTEAGLRQERDKLFYVSPFMDMPMRYRFRLRPPGETLAIRILETDGLGPILSATFIGKHTKLTSASSLGAFLQMPLMTLKVVMGIHYEAARLWFKGMRFFTRPAPPPDTSASGRFLPVELSRNDLQLSEGRK